MYETGLYWVQRRESMSVSLIYLVKLAAYTLAAVWYARCIKFLFQNKLTGKHLKEALESPDQVQTLVF